MATKCISGLSLLLLLLHLSLAASAPKKPVSCPAKCRFCRDGLVDCSDSKLINSPKIFPSGSRILNLETNYIRVLGPKSFKVSKSLEIIKLGRNRIRVIRARAFPFPSLMTLDLAENRIVKLYANSLVGLKKLMTLSLSNNKLRSTSRVFHNVPALHQLNLAFNRIAQIGERDFKMNKDLRYLDLRNNKITKIHPKAFSTFKYLRYLFLNNNPIQQLPEMTFLAHVLQLVDFSNCQLEHIPKGFPTSVSDFRLGHNQIQVINETDFENMGNLRLLALNDNKIHTIYPGAFMPLKRLDEVWLRGNNMTSFPKGIPDNVRKLYIDSNKVREIEEGVFGPESKLEHLTAQNNHILRIQNRAISGLRYLRTINLQSNKIQRLNMDSFIDLGNLTTLSLASNPLHIISKGAFRNLTNLVELSFSYAEGTDGEIHENFFTAMPKLKKLDMMGNPALANALMDVLTRHPDFVHESLRETDLTYNNLMTLPETLRTNFPNIKVLLIDGNPWICDDRLLWVKKWMSSSSVTFYSYELPMCDLPPNLHNTVLSDVPDDKFVKYEVTTLPPPPPPQVKEPAEDVPKTDNTNDTDDEVTESPNTVNGTINMDKDGNQTDTNNTVSSKDEKQETIKDAKPAGNTNTTHQAPLDAVQTTSQESGNQEESNDKKSVTTATKSEQKKKGKTADLSTPATVDRKAKTMPESKQKTLINQEAKAMNLVDSEKKTPATTSKPKRQRKKGRKVRRKQRKGKGKRRRRRRHNKRRKSKGRRQRNRKRERNSSPKTV